MDLGGEEPQQILARVLGAALPHSSGVWSQWLTPRLAAPSSAGGVQMPPASLRACPGPVVPGRASVAAVPVLLTILQRPMPWPQQQQQQPGRTCALQIDKAHSVYRGFFPCGCKIKEWERNLGCITASRWSTSSTQPCRASKTLPQKASRPGVDPELITT